MNNEDEGGGFVHRRFFFFFFSPGDIHNAWWASMMLDARWELIAFLMGSVKHSSLGGESAAASAGGW